MLRVQSCCPHIHDKILWEFFPKSIQGTYSLLCCVTYGVGILWFCLFGFLLKRNFSGSALLEGSGWGRVGDSHHFLSWKVCLFEVAFSLRWFVCLCPCLGAAECRPAAVYSLSPACIRHPGGAGTDPDACHQCSTGMCCRDSGLELGTSWSWLLTKCSAHSSRHLILQQEPPPPPARLFCTPRDRWGLSEDWIQSVSLTIVLLSDKETQGRGSLKDT